MVAVVALVHDWQRGDDGPEYQHRESTIQIGPDQLATVLK